MVSKLTWGLQHTKENTGGILPHWQPSKNPKIGSRASTRRDKDSVYRSTADLSTFTAVFIQLCACRICILKERSCSWSEHRLWMWGEKGRAQEISALFSWDVFLLQIPCAGDSASSLFVDILCHTDFFSCCYVVVSTLCALLMVFKAIDWQLCCFTVNQQKVIT